MRSHLVPILFALLAPACPLVEAAEPVVRSRMEGTVKGESPAQKALRAQADAVVNEAKRLQEAYNNDPTKPGRILIEAALTYQKAAELYGRLKDEDAVSECHAAIYWCKKQMNLTTMQAYVARAGHATGGGETGGSAPSLPREETAGATAPVAAGSPAEAGFQAAEAKAKTLGDDLPSIAALWQDLARDYAGTPSAQQAAVRAKAARTDYQTRLRAGTLSVSSRFQRQVAPPAGKGQAFPADAEIKRGLTDLKTAFGPAWNKRAAPDRRKLVERLEAEAEKRSRDAGVFVAAQQEIVRQCQELEDYAGLLQAIDRLAARFDGFDTKAQIIAACKGMQAKVTTKAIITLVNDPKDKAANTQVGRYFAITAGEWTEALPLLAQGADADLRAVAIEDLLEPEGDEAAQALGEQWYHLGKKRSEKDLRFACYRRAQMWFQRIAVVPEGPAGQRLQEQRAEIEKSLPLDMDRIIWKAVTPAQWERLKGPVVEVELRVDRTGAGIVLKDGERVRVVPHPSDRWTFRHRGYGEKTVGYQGIARSSLRTYWYEDAVVSGLPFGALTMGVGSERRQEVGVISGPGPLWFEPNRGDLQSATGAIRVKIIPATDP